MIKLKELQDRLEREKFTGRVELNVKDGIVIIAEKVERKKITN